MQAKTFCHEARLQSGPRIRRSRDHQRRNFEPISAPSAAHTAIANVYQVVTNATESVGQYIAYAIADTPPESAPMAAPVSVMRVGEKARMNQVSNAAAGAASIGMSTTHHGARPSPPIQACQR